MEILYIIGFFIAIWLIGAFFSWIGELIEKHKSKIRDQVLSDFQREYDIQGEIKKYQHKLVEVDFEKKEGFLNKYFIEKNFRLVGELKNFLSDCPSCKKGHLLTRKGKYGSFIGCSNFPNCKHTENITNAKGEYKTAVKDQIIADIQKAYN